MYTLLHYPSEHFQRTFSEENAAEAQIIRSFIVSNSYNQEKLLIATDEKASKEPQTQL